MHHPFGQLKHSERFCGVYTSLPAHPRESQYANEPRLPYRFSIRIGDKGHNRDRSRTWFLTVLRGPRCRRNHKPLTSHGVILRRPCPQNGHRASGSPNAVIADIPSRPNTTIEWRWRGANRRGFPAVRDRFLDKSSWQEMHLPLIRSFLPATGSLSERPSRQTSGDPGTRPGTIEFRGRPGLKCSVLISSRLLHALNVCHILGQSIHDRVYQILRKTPSAGPL